MLISLFEVWTVVRISSNAYSRNIHILVSLCEHGTVHVIYNWPSYRFSPLAKKINCMKILPFIATMLMKSNIEQTTYSFLDYWPPPPFTAPTHARALTVVTASETFTLTCFTREACKYCDGEAVCVNPDQTALSGSGWGGSTLIDQTYHFKYLVK